MNGSTINSVGPVSDPETYRGFREARLAKAPKLAGSPEPKVRVSSWCLDLYLNLVCRQIKYRYLVLFTSASIGLRYGSTKCLLSFWIRLTRIQALIYWVAYKALKIE